MFSLNGAVRYKYIPNYQDMRLRNFPHSSDDTSAERYCGGEQI